MTRRWHPVDHEHEWRKAVIERLDRIITLLEQVMPSRPPTDRHLCPLCGRSFGSEHALKVHRAVAHKE